MAVNRRPHRNIRAAAGRLARDESGAAYTLSYVMVLPILMLLVAMLVETSLMLIAKLGTVHAAYVAARVASVQTTPLPWPAAEERAQRAARQAMIPFASGSRRSGAGGEADDDYRKAYRVWADDPVADAYIESKQRDVAANVRVQFEQSPTSWDADLSAEVTYRYPFRIPGIGRLIGDPDGDGYTFPLTTRVTLSNDAPQNESQKLGIGYGSR